MDQVNPLAELTHKRRLERLGPGGLSRDRAGFEVRDVHYTHYGRMCPIETPEGSEYRLIVSLANYTRVNEYGFLRDSLPEGRQRERPRRISNTSPLWTRNGTISPRRMRRSIRTENSLSNLISCPEGRRLYNKRPERYKYMDVSPKQVISVSTSLIPFLEHDDANRALMGSNMQRQAVPFVFRSRRGSGPVWRGKPPTTPGFW